MQPTLPTPPPVDQAGPAPSLLPAACAYASRGWLVLPLHTPGTGGCSCHRRDCQSPGKHPRTQHGLDDASTDAETLRHWWGMWPDANIGIVTGSKSGFLVVDIDPRNGGARPDGLPETIEAMTGGGGAHLLYEWPQDLISVRWPKAVAHGVDLKADRGYIVAPPSLHASGARYTWRDGYGPAEHALAPLPAVLRVLAREASANRRSRLVNHADGPIPEGERNDRLAAIAGSMRRVGVPPEAIALALHEVNRLRCTPLLADAEVEAIARSISRYAPSTSHATEPSHVASLPIDGVLPPTEPEPEEAPLHPLGRTYATACQILRRMSQPLFGNKRLEWNDLRSVVELGGVSIDDSLIGVVMEKIERGFVASSDAATPLRFPAETIERAIEQVAREATYHPVRRYLAGLRWDGVARIADLPAKVLACEGNDLAPVMMSKWFVGAARRILHPGTKVDTALILQGPQGVGKSRFFRALGDEWTVEIALDVHDKDSLLALHSAWILEWPELESMHRSRDAGAVKAFLSTTHDSYRPPYGHYTVHRPRSSTIVGTTNQQDNLFADTTGTRRFWVVRCGRIDLDAVESQRDQLWAEAVERARSGEPHWLDDAAEDARAADVAPFVQEDPWQEIVEHWILGKDEVKMSEILTDGLERLPGQINDRVDSRRVAAIMRTLGWVRRHDRRGWTWRRDAYDPTVTPIVTPGVTIEKP